MEVGKMSEKLIKVVGDTTARTLYSGGPTVSTGVSRKLDPTNRSFVMALFQQAKPPLDSEVNLLQQIQNHLRAEMFRNIISSGILSMTCYAGVTDVKNCIRLENTVAVVDGYVLGINGSNRSDSLSDIVFPESPYTGSREDLAFLEVWFQEVAPSGSKEDDDENVYKYGGKDSGTLTNDLEDSIAGAETTRRVQLRWKIRTVSDIDFTTYPKGIDNATRVKARGNSSSDTSYSFSLKTGNLYVAGDGSSDSCTSLGCIDGYVFAIPLFRVHRRNQTSYSSSDNAEGAPSYTSGKVIPSGKFYDVIDSGDITHLWNYCTFYSDDNHTDMDVAVKELFGSTRQLSVEIDKWNKQRVQQGSATIYNKFVVFGGIVSAISGTRNVQLTKTGSYVQSNYSLMYLDGSIYSFADTSDSVASVPANRGTSAVSYYAYVSGDKTNGYSIKVEDSVPEGKLGLYRITVPAGDTSANLNSVIFTDIRRVEKNYTSFYSNIPSTYVDISGYPVVNSNYEVVLSVEDDEDGKKTELDVIGKTQSGFTIRNLSTSDNVKVQYTLISNGNS